MRRQYRTHQRACTGNRGKVVTKQDVLVRRYVIKAVIEPHRRRGAIRIQLHHMRANEARIETVANEIDRDGSDHNPQRVNGLAARQCHGTQCKGTQ